MFFLNPLLKVILHLSIDFSFCITAYLSHLHKLLKIRENPKSFSILMTTPPPPPHWDFTHQLKRAKVAKFAPNSTAYINCFSFVQSRFSQDKGQIHTSGRDADFGRKCQTAVSGLLVEQQINFGNTSNKRLQGTPTHTHTCSVCNPSSPDPPTCTTMNN